MRPDGQRYTVAVDFDGVLHSYTSPWINEETIPDPPVCGAIEWLRQIEIRFDVAIHTTRGKTAAGREAVRRWLCDNGWDSGRDVVVTAEKIPALIYIDDRAWRFSGTFPTAQEIHAARPWNKRGQVSRRTHGSLREESGERIGEAVTRREVELTARVRELEAENVGLRKCVEAADTFVEAAVDIDSSTAMMSVYNIAEVHHCPYNGANWSGELANYRAARAEVDK